MHKLAIALSLTLTPSVSEAAVTQTPWYWQGIVRSHCSSPNVRCTNYKDGNTLTNFTYVGDGHKKVFMLNWRLWQEYGGDDYMNADRTATRKDILVLNKKRIQLAQSACAGSAIACGVAVTAIPLIIPKIILSFTCGTGATYCNLRTEDEIAQIDAEIKELDSVAAGSSSDATGGGSPPAPTQPAPSLPPVPNGVVTINDNPHNKKNIP